MENLRQRRRLGRFTAQSFPVVHSVPTVGYLIEHNDFGRVLYVTDCSYIEFKFRNLNTILIEANWGQEFVHKDEPKYMHSLQHHMSIETCVETIRANTSSALRHVVLCHLSGNNSDERAFKEAVRKIVPSDVTVDIAVPGGVVDLRDVPF